MKSFKTGAHRARRDDRLAIYRLMQAVAAFLHNHAELSDLPSGKCLLALSLSEERLSLSCSLSLCQSISVPSCHYRCCCSLIQLRHLFRMLFWTLTPCCQLVAVCLWLSRCVCMRVCLFYFVCWRWLLSFQHRGICMIHCVYLCFWLPWFNVSIVRKVSSSPVILCKFPTCTRHEGPPDGGSMRIE